MNDQNCGNCKYSKVNEILSALNCRRYPPRTVAKASHMLIDVFPCVEKEGWCGEWDDKVKCGVDGITGIPDLYPIEIKSGVFGVCYVMSRKNDVDKFVDESINVLKNFSRIDWEYDRDTIIKEVNDVLVSIIEPVICFAIYETEDDLLSLLINTKTVVSVVVSNGIIRRHNSGGMIIPL